MEQRSAIWAQCPLFGLDLIDHMAEPGMAFRQIKQKIPDRIVLVCRQAAGAMAAHMGLKPVHLIARQRLLHHSETRARTVAALGNVFTGTRHARDCYTGQTTPLSLRMASSGWSCASGVNSST